MTFCSHIRYLIVVSLTLASNLHALPFPRQSSTDLSSVKIVKVRIRGSSGRIENRYLGCQGEIPGEIKTQLFVPVGDTLKKYKRQGSKAQKKILEYTRLGRAGDTACKNLSEEDPTLISQTVTISEEVSSIFLGSQVVNIFSSIGSSNVASFSSIAEILALLDSEINCAGKSITRSGSVITVDLGTSCSIGGQTFSGVFTVGVSLTSTSVKLNLEFVDLTAGGFELNGSGAVTAKAGSVTLELNLSVVQASTSYSIQFSGSIKEDGTGFLLAGTGELSATDLSADFRIIDVHKSSDQGCYPDDGSIELTLSGSPTITVTFSDETSSNGTVTVQVGQFPSTQEQLPNCPS